MNYYKAKIQYDGTGYFGFQWQKDLRTIQDDFNQSLQRLLPGKVTTMGASRTDTGVHAVEQVVKITAESSLDCGTFAEELNRILPPQIRCLGIGPCDGLFRPSVHSTSKEYRYLFTNKLHSSCVDQRFFANNPYKLNLDLMMKCTEHLTGTRDYRNFCSVGSNVTTTVREIIRCDLTEVDPHLVLPRNELFPLPTELRTCYQFRIEGTGFLKQMVRHLVSALWLVGGGKISPEEFVSLINGPQKTRRLWKVATPRGLYLYRLNYP